MSNRMPQPPAAQEKIEPSEETQTVSASEETPEVEKVMTDSPESATTKILKKESRQGVEVVALRDGFFQHRRRAEGDRFFVSSMDKVGTWMKCVDPKAELEHQKMMKDKKLKANKKSAED